MRLSSLFVSVTSIILACSAAAAFAMERPFPPIAKRGKMNPAPHPQIVIDGKERKLSPGARIWNTENLIEMPAAVRDGTYLVNYTEDNEGAVDRIWMLTRDEARQPAPNKK